MTAPTIVSDRETKTSAAGIPGACLVEPNEPLEDTLTISHRNAGAVVGHRQPDHIADATERDVDGNPSVALGIVDQVANHPVELIAIAHHRSRQVESRRGHGETHPADLTQRFGDHSNEIHDLGTARLLGVEASEQEEILGEVLQTLDIAQCVSSDDRPARLVRMGN